MATKIFEIAEEHGKFFFIKNSINVRNKYWNGRTKMAAMEQLEQASYENSTRSMIIYKRKNV